MHIHIDTPDHNEHDSLTRLLQCSLSRQQAEIERFSGEPESQPEFIQFEPVQSDLNEPSALNRINHVREICTRISCL